MEMSSANYSLFKNNSFEIFFNNNHCEYSIDILLFSLFLSSPEIISLQSSRDILMRCAFEMLAFVRIKQQ